MEPCCEDQRSDQSEVPTVYLPPSIELAGDKQGNEGWVARGPHLQDTPTCLIHP